MNFKEELFWKLWKEEDKTVFEQWLYNSNSIDFQSVVGEEPFLEIISENYSGSTIKQLKLTVFNNLTEDLRSEFRNFVNTNQKVIKATCVKTKSLDYNGKTERNWELNIGQEYYVLSIQIDIKKTFHQVTFQILDTDCCRRTPYIIPAELFEIKNRVIPQNYVISFDKTILTIDPKEFVNDFYIPEDYSFWEDYFDGHEKAVKIFNETTKRLDIDIESEKS